MRAFILLLAVLGSAANAVPEKYSMSLSYTLTKLGADDKGGGSASTWSGTYQECVDKAQEEALALEEKEDTEAAEGYSLASLKAYCRSRDVNKEIQVLNLQFD
jgi:hypothetical protein